MPSSTLLKAKGLVTSPNLLEVTEGGLLEASNVIIRRDDVVESRRGFKIFGEVSNSVSELTKQLLTYKGRVLAHHDSKLYFDSTGTGDFLAFTGSISEVQTGLRIKSIESNKNLYLTSSNGLKKVSAKTVSNLSSSLAIEDAGVVGAVDLTSVLNITPGSSSGFLNQDSAVAYRVVWGKKDNAQNLLLGAPSTRQVIYNELSRNIIFDFFRICQGLDAVSNTASTATSFIRDGNYVSSFTSFLPSSSTADQIYEVFFTNATNFAKKLDEDILIANQAGTAPITISSASISSGVCTLTVSGTNPDTFFNGNGGNNIIYLSGFTGASINGPQLVTATSSTTIQFSTDASGSVTVTGASVYSGKYRYINNNGALESVVPPAFESGNYHQNLEILNSYLEHVLTMLSFEVSNVISISDYATHFSTLAITSTANVNLRVTIPPGISASSGHFLQIYRTVNNTAVIGQQITEIEPSDEMFQIYETFPTTSDFTNGYVDFTDNVPDTFLQSNTPLYTNQFTGQGATQTNNKPPLAKDVNRFKNVTFYANTETEYKTTTFDLLGVSNISNNDKLYILNNSQVKDYTFVFDVAQVASVSFSTITGLNSTYFNLHSGNNDRSYYVWFSAYSSAGTDPAIANATGIKVVYDTSDTTTVLAQRVRDALNVFSYDFSATASSNTVTITNQTKGISTAITNGSGGGAVPSFATGVITLGVGEDAATRKIARSTLTGSQAITATARSIVRIVNRNAYSSNEAVTMAYVSAVTSTPGKMTITAKDFVVGQYYFQGSTANVGASFSPAISPVVIGASASYSSGTVTVTSASHGLSSGASILVTKSNGTTSIDGIYTITVVNANTFTFSSSAVVSLTSLNYSEEEDFSTFSDNEVKPNRIYYSKLQQPEAVPVLNYLSFGAEDKEILRIFPLRDSLFVFKEDGLFRISGEVAPFNGTLFDSSCILIAADSISVANNVIYGWTKQGIQTISESGVSLLSRNIDNIILPKSSTNYSNFKTATWGIGYDSDNSYTVFTTKNTSDTHATIAYRFSNLTNSWTSFDLAKTCGIINSEDDLMYLGASDLNAVEQERKTFSRLDKCDRELADTITTSKFFGKSIQFLSVSDYAVGDVLIQEQTLTIYLYNQLLSKFDLETSLDNDYRSTLEASAGQDIIAKFSDLVTKLANDPTRLAFPSATAAASYTALLSPAITTFTELQSRYNSFVGLLNLDASITFTYVTITNITTLEAIVVQKNAGSKTLTFNYALDFVDGAVTFYKNIPCSIKYAPNVLGSPLALKHVRDCTFMFINRTFTNGVLTFLSDIYPEEQRVPFDFEGNGIFGMSSGFGEGYFGGDSNSAPVRTFVPRPIQRCRYIVSGFSHSVAREEFGLVGMSFTFEVVSERAYR